MRSIRFVVLGLLATMLTAASVHGQEQRRRPLVGGDPIGGPLIAKETMDKLKLTSEQQAKFDKIVKEFDAKARDNETKAHDAMQKARADMDRAAAKQAQELLAEARKAREGYMGQVLALLTDEQKKVIDRPAVAARNPGAAAPAAGQLLPPALLERLGVTAEQKEKLNQLQKDFEAKALQVLTEEQRQKYEQFKKGRRPRQEQSRQRESALPATVSLLMPARIERLN